ncbi:MAG: hypothetical protein IPM42_10610 [Saprospiraceae bacterium]|nr:hypothetical protein [Saprospiraceae bacterium]
MNLKSYLFYLVLVNILTLGILYYVDTFDRTSPYFNVGLTSLCLFTVFSTGLYLILRYFAKHPNKQLFLSGTVFNMFFKMLFSVGILMLYYVIKKPGDGAFVIPFLVVYVTFTIFETFFMLQLAQEKPANK